MNKRHLFFDDLSDTDVEQIKTNAYTQQFQKGELIFSEGDPVYTFYIIEQGSVSVFFTKDGEKKELGTLTSGEYFGEMGIINQDKRSASVITLQDTNLLCIDRDSFISFMENHPLLAEKINKILIPRNEELILRESLMDITGLRSEHMYVSIKGDPSLRETALFRERYESPVDKILSRLEPGLEELLLNRCAYQLTINFNSGEIRIRSVFEPFKEEVHTADMLVDPAYIERHFPKITYKEKIEFIYSACEFISTHPRFKQLPVQWKNIINKTHDQCQPLAKEIVIMVMSRLSKLRDIPNFYLRNLGINITQDAIRMQFNCDGTHIVCSDDYQKFIKQNFEA